MLAVRPVLFEIRGVKVHAYPALLFIGLTFGVIAGRDAGAAWGLEPRRLYAALVLLIVPALLGSRLLYVLTHWSFYRRHPALVLSTRDGGAALYGGLLLALACSWPLLRAFVLPPGTFWDAATITILVGMVFTKIGCLLQGCCAGRVTTSRFALSLPNAQGVWCRRLPVQLLESGLAALLLFGALAWSARPFDGALFLAAAGIYGAARLALESSRESTDRLSGFNVYRVISLLLVAASIAAFAMHRWIQP